MATKIYGTSDDLIEFEGDVSGEASAMALDGADSEESGTLVICSDCTLLEVKYGKKGEGIWAITLIRKGTLFEKIDQCDDADADPYSDVAHFKKGLKWAYTAGDWEKVK